MTCVPMKRQGISEMALANTKDYTGLMISEQSYLIHLHLDISLADVYID